jgi:hypothetical protein
VIHKFLVVGKQMQLVSIRPAEIQGESDVVLDLSMPLDVYWEIHEILKSIDYLVSTNEPAAKINDIYVKVFRKVAQYAVTDKDRTWFYERIQGKTGTVPPA